MREAGRHFITNRAHGALGYAMSAAIGAWFADPRSKCVAIMGDGSFGFSVGELETVVRCKVPLLMLVLSNATYGWIKASQKASYGGRYFSVDFSRTDHARDRRGLRRESRGGWRTRTQLGAVLREARRTRRSGAGRHRRAVARRRRRAGPAVDGVTIAMTSRYMGRRAGWIMAAAVFATPMTAADAQRYSADQQGEVVTLTDRGTDTVVSVVPSVGNIATEMKVKGHNVLRFPHASLADFKARPGATGIPFMGPWANRLDEQAFYANGRRHAFDMTLGNVRGEVPIHGFLTTTNLWRVTSVTATAESAAVTSRLDVYKQPAWMRQWPYRAHRRDHLSPLRRRARSGDRRSSTSATSPCRSRSASTPTSS